MAQQTNTHNKDCTLTSWPASPQAWLADEPLIVFTIGKDAPVNPGDRILAKRGMVTSGPGSGGIEEIYYYIRKDLKAIIGPETKTVTAVAKRVIL